MGCRVSRPILALIYVILLSVAIMMEACTSTASPTTSTSLVLRRLGSLISLTVRDLDVAEDHVSDLGFQFSGVGHGVLIHLAVLVASNKYKFL